MELETDEERELFAKGEENRVRRQAMSQDSLFNIPPSQEEQRIIHDFFIKTVDHKVNYDGICTCSSCNKKNIVRRQAMSEDSLFNTPPSQEEQRIIHDDFIKTVDHKVNYDWISTSTGSSCKKKRTGCGGRPCLRTRYSTHHPVRRSRELYMTSSSRL
jgi:hypothetical protein